MIMRDDAILRETAFHEAGHAVVGFTLGMEFKERAITIVPTTELAGCVFFEDRPRKTRDDLCVTFAGLLAQSFTAEDSSVGKRLWRDAKADVRAAAAALLCVTLKKEMWEVLVESCLPPGERGAAFDSFYNLFARAMEQSHLPQPEAMEGDSAIFLELHSAAYKARTLLTDHWRLLHDLGLRLLEVREMSRDELTTFLEQQSASA
jgi:hypothetical protein